MVLLRRKTRHSKSRVEEKFQTIVDLIKDLDKKEFNRLKEGIDLAWQCWDKIKHVKTKGDKQNGDIDEIEEALYDSKK